MSVVLQSERHAWRSPRSLCRRVAGAVSENLPMLPRHDEPIVAIATAPGRGAVGIVRASGRDLAPLIHAVCGRALAPRHATYLPFAAANGQPIDQGLAIHFPAPQSYTGEDVLELQAHGGPVVGSLSAPCAPETKKVGPSPLPARMRKRPHSIPPPRGTIKAGAASDAGASVVRYRTTEGVEYTSPLWMLVQHVANHSTYHRGQLTTFYRQLGARAVNTDLVTWDRDEMAKAKASGAA